MNQTQKRSFLLHPSTIGHTCPGPGHKQLVSTKKESVFATHISSWHRSRPCELAWISFLDIFVMRDVRACLCMM